MIRNLAILCVIAIFNELVAQECGNQFNGYRTCLAEGHANTVSKSDMENMYGCFKRNNCAAPDIKEIFIKVMNMLEPGGSRQRSTRCLAQYIPKLSKQVEDCVRSRFPWFTIDYSGQERDLIKVLLSSEPETHRLLCLGDKGKANSVKNCLSPGGNFDVQSKTDEICNVKRSCDNSDRGFSPTCWRQQANMVMRTCRCIKNMLKTDNAKLLDDVLKCNFGHLPFLYAVSKPFIINNMNRLKCQDLRNRVMETCA